MTLSQKELCAWLIAMITQGIAFQPLFLLAKAAKNSDDARSAFVYATIPILIGGGLCVFLGYTAPHQAGEHPLVILSTELTPFISALLCTAAFVAILSPGLAMLHSTAWTFLRAFVPKYGDAPPGLLVGCCWLISVFGAATIQDIIPFLMGILALMAPVAAGVICETSKQRISFPKWSWILAYATAPIIFGIQYFKSASDAKLSYVVFIQWTTAIAFLFVGKITDVCLLRGLRGWRKV